MSLILRHSTPRPRAQFFCARVLSPLGAWRALGEAERLARLAELRTHFEAIKDEMVRLVEGSFDDYYPEVALSFATGRRADRDAEGNGPGMVSLAVSAAWTGVRCFSGAHSASPPPLCRSSWKPLS